MKTKDQEGKDFRNYPISPDEVGFNPVAPATFNPERFFKPKINSRKKKKYRALNWYWLLN